MNEPITKKIVLDNPEEAKRFFGKLHQNILLVADAFKARIVTRGNEIKIIGGEAEVSQISRLIEEMRQLAKTHGYINPEEVKYSIRMIKASASASPSVALGEVIPLRSAKKSIAPKTIGQKRYIQAIRENDIVFGIGPAGTGKTYLAMAMAVSALKNGEADRIILARPAVEAGEKLGFLPGDLFEKVNPYLRPLYDALYDMLDLKKVERLMQEDVIEVVPLAFMRGRTLHKSFVILDEAQNCTHNQMKMFLTRLGPGSKAVITGDVTQTDLPANVVCGLVEAQRLLGNIKGIEFIYFDLNDVVRHELVAKIIHAYEKDEKNKT